MVLYDRVKFCLAIKGGNKMININVKIDADVEHFDVERFKQQLQEFMELILSGYYDFSVCMKDVQKEFLTKEIIVVNMFDQANTGGSIEKLGYRGNVLKEAIDDLRDHINQDKQLTILTSGQASGR